MSTHLYTFVGTGDLRAAGLLEEPGQGDAACVPGPRGPGAVARAADFLGDELESVTLIDDRPDPAMACSFARWLAARIDRPVHLVRFPLEDPGCFESACRAVGAAMAQRRRTAGLRHAVLTTPGTAAMAMAWIFMAVNDRPGDIALLSAGANGACRWLALPAGPFAA